MTAYSVAWALPSSTALLRMRVSIWYLAEVHGVAGNRLNSPFRLDDYEALPPTSGQPCGHAVLNIHSLSEFVLKEDDRSSLHLTGDLRQEHPRYVAHI